MNNKSPILIVGAGPVGAILAIKLAMNGVPFRIIDKRGGPTELLRAIGVSKATEAIFKDVGVLDRIKKQAKFVRGVKISHLKLGGLLFKYDEVFPGSPGYLHIYQPVIESVLSERLSELGVEIERQVELCDLQHDANCTEVALKKTDGTTFTERYDLVVGCDGASSSVRKLGGFSGKEEVYGEAFFLVDVMLKDDQLLKETSWYLDDVGYLVLIPGPGNKARIVFSGNASEDFKPDIETLVKLVQAKTGLALPISKVIWETQANFMHRYTDHPNQGRTVLAGDAYHIFSPIGGVNMNFGIKDAEILASFLIDAYKKDGCESLKEAISQYGMTREVEVCKAVKFTCFLTGLMTKPKKNRRIWEWFFNKVRTDSEFVKKLIIRFSGVGPQKN